MNSHIHHQNGAETKGVRVSPDVAQKAGQELQQCIREQTPIEGSGKIIRRVIDEHVRGEPEYESMSPALAALARQQFDIILSSP